MTTPNAAPTNAAPAEQTNGAGVVQPMSVEDRADALFGTSEPAAEVAPASPDASASGEPDAAAQARAARRAALADLNRKERERVDAMAAIRERDQLRRELEQERERGKAYASHVDPSKLSKEQFFALAEKNPDLTPQELGEWLRERMANPELAAAKAARTAIDPEIAKLREDLAKEREWRQQFEQQQQRAHAEAEERAAEAQFAQFAHHEAPQSAPVTATFIAEHGMDEFMVIARSAAQRVPAYAGPQAILDEVEELLSALARPWLKKTNQQSRASATSGTVPAAQGGISNTLAQQRSSVVDEDAEFSKLSLQERAARVFG